MTYEFSRLSKRIVKSEIKEIVKWARKPGIISFCGGLPDASLFPIRDLIGISGNVLEKKGYMALQYGPTQGEAEMLEALAGHMKMYDEHASLEQVCVTSSSQQGLDLVSQLFLDEGAPLIMELPSYLGAIQVFHHSGADMRGIPMDEDGMNIDDLLAALDKLEKEGKKPRFIYTIPDFQNPSGITMSLERRKKLVKIARQREILIVEDSPYRELSFTGSRLPSLWTISGGKGVIMLKTFSKVLFPGMRMGWVVGEDFAVEKITLLKQSVDVCTPPFNQFIMADFLKQGKMKEIIEKAIECYKPKLAAMLNALEKHMPEGVSWSRPKGGMFLWVVLPGKTDPQKIFMSAVEHNVVYVTGPPFHCDNSGGNTLRLNYSFPPIEQIEKGIKQLAGAIKTVL